MQRPPASVDLVLVGAGHAHVEVLRRHAMRPIANVRITLIAREPRTPYSGMLPGVIRGDYHPDQASIDCAPLAAAAGVRLVMAEAERLDLTARRVEVTGRPPIAFDLLSLDVGGTPPMPPDAGTPVKPIGRFLAQLEALEADLPRGAPVAVVGGGAGGTELALALACRGRMRPTLVIREPTILVSAPSRARRVAEAALQAAGVTVIAGVAATGRHADRLHLADGRAIEARAVFWATGVIAPAFLAASGLACDADGCVRVAATLCSLSDPAVFAAGDCAVVEGNPRPKAGVWAVRAGRPLTENLRRAVAGRRLKPWRPQPAALVILGTGNGRAIAWRGDTVLAGRLAWLWKDRIDRRWMRMYQRLRPMAMDDARCGGCGAKLGGEALTAALAGLAPAPRADIPLGLADRDDAAVTLPPPGMAVVQSVDHFRAFIDDPVVFGAIAAAHALSDIYAMGAKPWTAMAIAGLPAGPKAGADLAAMMQGAARVLAEEGCALIGGHSAEAAEVALGFAVTGLVAPGDVWRKAGLVAGQALVLTKPLGTGIILAAQMRGLARAEWLAEAVGSMRRCNGEAAQILRAHGATACTDVTGFGLAGHLREMLDASGVGAEINLSALPLLAGAENLAGDGVASTMAPANAAASEIDHPLMIDPQTSGGLLSAIDPSRVASCVAALIVAGYRAARIGRVTDQPRCLALI